MQASGQANVSLAIKEQSPDSSALKLIGDSLVATRSLDFETQSSYNVTIVATDSGNPPLSTSLTVTIEVKIMFVKILSVSHFIHSRCLEQVIRWVKWNNELLLDSKISVYHVTEGKGQTVLSVLETEETKGRYSPGTITKSAE